MLASVEGFVRYFEGVHRRTFRDISALPADAAYWSPPAGEGENAWSVSQLVRHICELRAYFVSAYRGEGWLLASAAVPAPLAPGDWREALESSAVLVSSGLAGTPEAWLDRRVPRLGSIEELAGWRILLMMVEHEVHHRSQLDTYAGLNGWEPPQIFERRFEDVLAMQPAERARVQDPYR